MANLKQKIRKIVNPLPEDQKKQGFEPNLYIKSQRKLADFIIFILGLNGRGRFSNEFIQRLDPQVAVDLGGGKRLSFRTGHGRLVWRAGSLLQEEPMLIEWINTFNSDDVFYDVGANMGGFSLYAAQRGIKTYAIEPEINNLQLLFENIFLNELQELCNPIPIAMGDVTSKDVFYLKSISKGDALHSIGRKSYLLEDPDSVDFRLNTLVMRLDDLISTFNLTKPTKLKVDVDFNELKVVQGAIKTLESVQEVYIELDLKLEEHCQVIKIMENLGFDVEEKEDISRQFNAEISNYIFIKK